MGKAIIALIAVVLLLAGTLGLRVITFPSDQGRVICVFTKDQLSFSDTLISAHGRMELVLEHPLLGARVLTGQGACVGR
jgi:hypothetical protein